MSYDNPDVLADTISLLEWRRHQLTKARSDSQDNSHKRKKTFVGRVISDGWDAESELDSSHHVGSSFAIKVRLDDGEGNYCPSPCDPMWNSPSTATASKLNASLHQSAYSYKTMEKGQRPPQYWDRVWCEYVETGPDDNGKRRDLRFKHSSRSQQDRYTCTPSAARSSQISFAQSRPLGKSTEYGGAKYVEAKPFDGKAPSQFRKVPHSSNCHRGAKIKSYKQMKLLKDKYKIKRIVSLALDARDKIKDSNFNCSGRNPACEPAWAKDLGIEFYHISLNSDTIPTNAQWQKIKSWMKSGDCYVHCTHGVDRTGAVVARYLKEVHPNTELGGSVEKLWQYTRYLGGSWVVGAWPGSKAGYLKGNQIMNKKLGKWAGIWSYTGPDVK